MFSHMRDATTIGRVCKCLVSATMAAKVIKCATCNIVICELLAFMQNKIGVMDEESLVRLCSTAFTVKEIEDAKNLLFGSITTNIRKIVRKNAGKEQRDLYDIISIFKQTQTEIVPIFVAKDLHKLPPVTFDYVDVTRTLKDLIIMRNEIEIIKNTYATKVQLREIENELEDLKHTSVISYNYDDMNINKNRGGGGRIDSCCDSGPMGLPHIIEKANSDINGHSKQNFVAANKVRSLDNTILSNIDLSLSHQREPEKPVSPLHMRKPQTPERVEYTGELERTNCMSATEKLYNDCSSELGVWSKRKINDVLSNDKVGRKQENNTSEWKTVAGKRKKNRFVHIEGMAVSTQSDAKFRAAEIKIPLFIYKVNNETTERDITDYINRKTNLCVTVKKINIQKHNRYSAFKIFVPHEKLSTFLINDLWPEGVRCRKFIYFNRNSYDTRKGSEPKIDGTQNMT